MSIDGSWSNCPLLRNARFRRWALLFAGLSILAAAACTGQQTQKSVALGEQTTLAIGEEASVNGEPLRVAFREVVSDSRCPEGATCVWQGEASCRLEIAFQGSANTVIVTQPGLAEGAASVDFNDYQIQFRLRPYPELGHQIKNSDYRLQLAINKQR